MTNKTNKVLYTRITNHLMRRVYEHRNGIVEGFTSKYKTHKLVYAESFDNPVDAIAAEKRIKGWLRSKKIELIESQNPKWKDLMIGLEKDFTKIT